MSAPTPIQLPAGGWALRPYQQPLWDYLIDGGKRAAAVWHRRAGKDAICLNWTAVAAHQRVATYWHMLPEYGQCRKAIWDAVNPHTGVRIIDQAFPKALRAKTREDEMMIRFKCGSSWQLVGSDNYDSLVGSPPAGVVFSEWALARPRAWDYLRPILAENDGWGLFIYTPRGRNHGLNTLETARADPAWFAQVLTVKDTEQIPAHVLANELRELVGMWGAEEGQRIYDQEYMCSFSAAIRGAYYGSILERLEVAKQITRVPYDPAYPVTTAWDLGIGDATAIWFLQPVGREVRVLDYYETTGQGLDHYAGVLRAKPYGYLEHLLPHDAEARELGTGRTRVETLQRLGIGRVRVMPRQSVDDGIAAVRNLLPLCFFDAEKCAEGLEALRSYRADFDEKHETLKATPVHDWASHGADAFRTGALGLRASPMSTRHGITSFDGSSRPRVIQAIMD